MALKGGGFRHTSKINQSLEKMLNTEIFNNLNCSITFGIFHIINFLIYENFLISHSTLNHEISNKF
jgi:hypothetical protein